MEDYITLKEAAKISGYAPDYLGQLIRKGKLPGKQIYLNVAWVTTEKDLKEYMSKNKASAARPGLSLRIREKARTWLIAHSSPAALIRISRRVIYIVIAFLFIVVLFLVYAFGANLVRSITAQ